VEVGKNNAIELVKGKVGLVVEVFEIVPSQLLLVDVKVVEGDLEFENNHWEDWKVALQDLVISWHNEESS
jgi:carbon catabolite-derepressing protein kinase